jgi:S-adenosylmethionine:tRNA ribosyltransferase-isomerase
MAHITLNIGLGTFMPIKAEDTDEHIMHAESYKVSDKCAAQVNEAIDAAKIPLCIGTTTVRAVESAADDKGLLVAKTAATSLFITPGYKFKITKALITNFHLPRSTLLMLVAAMIGRDELMRVYSHAVEKRYRFYSYGDCMLIYPF